MALAQRLVWAAEHTEHCGIPSEIQPGSTLARRPTWPGKRLRRALIVSWPSPTGSTLPRRPTWPGMQPSNLKATCRSSQAIVMLEDALTATSEL